jgi:hypothetical protein
MARKRFRWTRKAYKHADWMARFYGRHIYELPERPPPLLQRYFDLWERHRQNDDPLLVPVRQRPGYADDDGIPF